MRTSESLDELRNTDPERYWRTRASRASDDSSAVLWENIHFNSCLREKEFATIRQLVAEHRIPRNFGVLDVGCGTGTISRFLVDLGFNHIDAIDLPEMIRLAERINPHPCIRYIVSSAQSYRVNEKYGLVISTGGLSSITNLSNMFTAIDNCIAMLMHGGHILLIDPFHKYINVRSRVSTEEVEGYLKRMGLSLVEKSGMIFWPFRWFLWRDLGLTAYQTRVLFDTGERMMTRLSDRVWSDYKVLLFNKS